MSDIRLIDVDGNPLFVMGAYITRTEEDTCLHLNVYVSNGCTFELGKATQGSAGPLFEARDLIAERMTTRSDLDLREYFETDCFKGGGFGCTFKHKVGRMAA